MAVTNAKVNLGINLILSLSGLILMLGSHLYPKLVYRVANYTLWKVGFMQFSLLWLGNKEQDLENEAVSAVSCESSTHVTIFYRVDQYYI